MKQSPIPSADLTGAMLQLDRDVLVDSVYVEPKNCERLLATIKTLHTQVTALRDATERRTDGLLAGDFSRHGPPLWRRGRDRQAARRGGPDHYAHGGAQPLSLLPRWTKTWENAKHAGTIDLVLVASAELAEEMRGCVSHLVDRGSNHWARTKFDVMMLERELARGGCSRTRRGRQYKKV